MFDPDRHYLSHYCRDCRVYHPAFGQRVKVNGVWIWRVVKVDPCRLYTPPRSERPCNKSE